jgi:hypothetical protein
LDARFRTCDEILIGLPDSQNLPAKRFVRRSVGFAVTIIAMRDDLRHCGCVRHLLVGRAAVRALAQVIAQSLGQLLVLNLALSEGREVRFHFLARDTAVIVRVRLAYLLPYQSCRKRAEQEDNNRAASFEHVAIAALSLDPPDDLAKFATVTRFPVFEAFFVCLVVHSTKPWFKNGMGEWSPSAFSNLRFFCMNYL